MKRTETSLKPRWACRLALGWLAGFAALASVGGCRRDSQETSGETDCAESCNDESGSDDAGTDDGLVYPNCLETADCPDREVCIQAIVYVDNVDSTPAYEYPRQCVPPSQLREYNDDRVGEGRECLHYLDQNTSVPPIGLGGGEPLYQVFTTWLYCVDDASCCPGTECFLSDWGFYSGRDANGYCLDPSLSYCESAPPDNPDGCGPGRTCWPWQDPNWDEDANWSAINVCLEECAGEGMLCWEPLNHYCCEGLVCESGTCVDPNAPDTTGGEDTTGGDSTSSTG